MEVSVQAAKLSLPELIEAAMAGEDVVLAENGEPVAKIVAIKRKKFQVGMLQGQFGDGPDFFEPMSDAELALWEGGA